MGKDNRPPKHLRTLKRGDVRDDGMVFWKYSECYKAGERWVNGDKFQQMLEQANPRDNRPPAHLRTLRRGDLRDDGMIFWEYTATSRDGETWLTSEEFNKKRQRRRETHRAYLRKRLADDIAYRVANNLRTRLRNAVIHAKGCTSSMRSLLGCTIDECVAHLESKFTDGMSWDNYGSWHIDHIKPCAAFDLTLDSEQRECFHFTNLQPLWAEDNLRKGKKEPMFL